MFKRIHLLLYQHNVGLRLSTPTNDLLHSNGHGLAVKVGFKVVQSDRYIVDEFPDLLKVTHHKTITQLGNLVLDSNNPLVIRPDSPVTIDFASTLAIYTGTLLHMKVIR